MRSTDPPGPYPILNATAGSLGNPEKGSPEFDRHSSLNPTQTRRACPRYHDPRALPRSSRSRTPPNAPERSPRTGSPPCQPFCKVGKQLDVEDPRCLSFLHLLSLLQDAAAPPSLLFLENVREFEGSRAHGRLLEVSRARPHPRLTRRHPVLNRTSHTLSVVAACTAF